MRPIAWLTLALGFATTLAAPAASAYEVNDSHFHLTNYIQQGTDIHRFLEIMGDKVGRVALFGIPLQQTWSYENSGDFAPTYYLQSDAPLYYYSFTDAWIASQYLSLKPRERARFDPMITGFNPADMYAVDHIKRVLQVFPGVFTGIGEFTIHKEFVSSKVAGDTASLTDPALDRILDFCAESGLLAIIHNDIDMPFAREGAEPVFLTQMKDLLRRHPETTVIWAHVGMGRVVHPVLAAAGASAAERSDNQVGIVTTMLKDPGLKHLYFDISWEEVAKYIVATPETTAPGGGHRQPVSRPLPVRHRRGGTARTSRPTSRFITTTIHSGSCSRRKRGRRSARATTSGCSMPPARKCAPGKRRTVPGRSFVIALLLRKQEGHLQPQAEIFRSLVFGTVGPVAGAG